jgi:diamine N-acetyltransferase
MSINIRKGTDEDLPNIYALIKEFAHFQKTPEKVKTTPDQMQKEKAFFHCYVAEKDGEMIGFASYFFAYYSWTGKSLYLDDLYVSDAFRGKGVGSALLNAVINLAKEEGCKKMRWQVSNWNKPAIGFYRKMGASIDDVEINCDLPL